ncbi:MAG: hypothetical protein H6828_14720 [Planctomycetes bacterium]|nr:hypothetical protein [Planctomycetota bacterium]
MSAKPRLALASLLAGASGVALEVVTVALAGGTVGYGVNAVLGLTVFLAGWSLGAGLAGSWRGSTRALLVGAGLALACAAWGVPLLLTSAAEGASSALAVALTLAALLAVAVPQGVFLPSLARQWRLRGRPDLGWLLAANLLGAALGAWLLGEALAARAGCDGAALGAGACALAAAFLGAWRRRAQPAEATATASEAEAHALAPRRAGLLLALATAWLARRRPRPAPGRALARRHATGADRRARGEPRRVALGAALLPRALGRRPAALARLGAAGPGRGVVPARAVALTRFADAALLVRALLLVGPPLAAFGAVVPLLHRELAGDSGRRLGRLFLWRRSGPAWACARAPRAAAARGLERHARRVVRAGRAAAGLALASARGLRGRWRSAWASRPGSRAAAARARVAAALNPALEVLAFEEDAHFAVSVVQDGLQGERTLMTDGFRAAGTGRDYAYMRALGHLPLLLHAAPRRVAVLAFGTGTTAGAVALHEEVERIDVLELSAAVAEQAPRFAEVNHGVLADPRTHLRLGDGRRTLGAAAGATT